MNQKRRSVAWLAQVHRPSVLVVCSCVGVGWLVAATNLGATILQPLTLSMLLFAFVALIGLLTLRSRKGRGLLEMGPGVPVALIVLSLASIAGIATGHFENPVDRERVLGLDVTAIAGLLVGSMAIVGTLGTSPVRPQPVVGRSGLGHPVIRGLMVLLLVFGILNLLTGSVPLLSSSIEVTRIAGGGGALGKVWTWLIGGLEWSVIVLTLVAVAAKRIGRGSLALATSAALILVSLADRSFLVLIGLAVLIGIASLRPVSLTRMCVGGAIAVLLLGWAGEYRHEHTEAAMSGHGHVLDIIEQSAGIGPEVFDTVLRRIPSEIPYQHGNFLLRDFRSAVPFHPFGDPENGGEWVTSRVRQRNAQEIGGTPPTLAGGLYIDFGIIGIIVGTIFIGAALTLMYRWLTRAPTFGLLAAYCYAAAFIALSAYSYVSVKPAVLAVFALCVVLHLIERRMAGSRMRSEG